MDAAGEEEEIVFYFLAYWWWWCRIGRHEDKNVSVLQGVVGAPEAEVRQVSSLLEAASQEVASLTLGGWAE